MRIHQAFAIGAEGKEYAWARIPVFAFYLFGKSIRYIIWICDYIETGLPVSLVEQGMKVRVVCYEGYKAEETPRAFLIGKCRIEVMHILVRF